jgi:transposase
MQDLELFEQILGIEKPWKVENINLDIDGTKVFVKIGYPKNTKALCPTCKKECTVYDRNQSRNWRHLDTMQLETMIECAIPRVNCQEHGILTIEVPWAAAKSRYTLLFEKVAIQVLLKAATQDSAKDILRLSWDEVHSIQERAVERGLLRRDQEGLKYIGIDEKSFLTGHKYITVLHNNETGKVIDIVGDRTEEAAIELLNSIPSTQRDSIEAVTMDMWASYINSVGKILPNADIVHDKFHIKGYLNKAVDLVRRQEHTELLKEKDTTLTKTKYIWLKNTENITNNQNKLFKILMLMHLNVGKAWSIKESFDNFWDYKSEAWANKFFKRWFFWATHSRLEPIIKVAYTIKNHFDGIITYIKHRISNAVAEGINSKIQAIKTSARGFRSFKNFRYAILFHCGGLELNP